MKQLVSIMLIIISLMALLGLRLQAEEASEIISLLKQSSDYSDLTKQKLAKEKLVHKGTTVIPSLISIMENSQVDISIRQEAMGILGDLEDQQAVRPLMNIAKEKKSPLRYTAFQTLGKIGDKKIAPLLIDILINDPDKEIREICAALLGGNLYVPEAQEALLEAALNDQEVEVRYKALESLNKAIPQQARVISEKNVLPTKRLPERVSFSEKLFNSLVKILREDNSGDVKVMAALSLSKYPEALPYLLDALKTNCALTLKERAAREDSQYRSHAMRTGERLTFCLIEAIGSYGKQAVPVLTEKLSQAKGDFKYAILVVLSDLSVKLEYDKNAQDYMPLYQFNSDLLPLCLEALQNSESGRIRARMAWILGENKYTNAIPALKDALTDEYAILSKNGVLYPVRQNAKASLKKMGLNE